MLVPVFMLDADLPAPVAREALAAVPEQAMIVVRRQSSQVAGPLRWYALSRFELDVMLAGGGHGQLLAAALDRYGHQPQPCAEADDAAVRAGLFAGIVVRGGRPVGYAAPAASFGPGRHTRAVELESLPVPPAPVPAAPARPTAPPRRRRTATAFPRVVVPAEVAPLQAFDVEIGLGEQRQSETEDQPITLALPPRRRVVEVLVQVVADGFTAPKGIRRTLLLPRDDLTSTTVRLPLVAPAVTGATWRGRIEVEYAVDGTLAGRAWRDVVVRAGAPALSAASTSGGALPLVDPQSPPADLTVSVTEGVRPGRMVWTFVSPHPVALPDEQVTTDLPTGSARAFALTWVSQIAAADRTPAAPARLEGVARAVASVTPVQFWSVLTAVWALVKGAGRVPTVLVVSSDPYIPWELVSTEARWVVDRTLVDEAMPQLLGAQVQLGRWAPAGPDTPSGVRRPASAPESGIDVERMAVVVGDYQSERGVRPLPFALEEGRAITETYPSVWVKGTLDEVTALLEGRLASDGTPAPAQVVHVACHGAVDPQHPAYSGIVLSDSALRIDQLTVLGGELGDAGAPLVFLNACQLGQAQGELLGDQGGLASAFLAVGCRGFVAPLWSVEDELARDLALDFYRYTLGDGLTVGAALRRLRGRFANIPGRTRTTPLAYVYYGHPDLRLTLADAVADG
ncbi:MAG: CHAT domain-containing protein [Dermatophilaceae bacterium]